MIALQIMAAASHIAPISVAQEGLSLGSKLMTGVLSAGFLGLIGVIIKTRVPLKELNLKSDEKLRESEEKLRKDLMDQLNKQEAEHTARVTALEVRLDEQRAMYEGKLDFERVVHLNDLTTMRHRMNNLDQCLTMLLALIEENPEKAQQAAKRVRQMREKQEASEASEKATLAAAKAIATVTVAQQSPPAPRPAKAPKTKP